jgi:hypothetical protein
MKVIRLIVVVLCAIVLLRLAACTTGLNPTPEPTQVPLPDDLQGNNMQTEETANPLVTDAVNAAINHLIESDPPAGNGAELPSQIDWQIENQTPPGLVGAVTQVFRGGGWEVTVEYPVVAPENMLYHITIRNTTTGYTWEGTLNADYEVVSP